MTVLVILLYAVVSFAIGLNLVFAGQRGDRFGVIVWIIWAVLVTLSAIQAVTS